MARVPTVDAPRRIQLIAFVVGASPLGTEIAAARLLAPYFGASTMVWANTIAVVLVALSVGYWFGGRCADRHPHLRGLCLLVLGAAVLIGARALRARPFLGFSVDAFDASRSAASPARCSAVLVLVAVPVTLLGAVVALGGAAGGRRVDAPGEVAGRLYAISTPGRCSGRCSRAAADPARWARSARSSSSRWRWPLVAAAGLAAPRGRWPRSPSRPARGAGRDDQGGRDRRRVLDEAETDAPVRAGRRTARRRARAGAQRGPGGPLALPRRARYLTGDYWDGPLVLPFAGARPRRRGAVAILGNAGGTAARAYGHFFPGTRGRRGRDRRRADRARPPLVRPARAAACTRTPRTRGPGCAAPTAATT